MSADTFANPFRPGAGHMPPYLAGREKEKKDFDRFLAQEVILQNVILTGLRGVGKTVLMETFKPMAIEKGWLWVRNRLVAVRVRFGGSSCHSIASRFVICNIGHHSND